MNDEPCKHLLDPTTCTMCNGRDAAERKLATTVTTMVPSRYASLLNCGHFSVIGERISRLGNGNWVCEDCAP